MALHICTLCILGMVIVGIVGIVGMVCIVDIAYAIYIQCAVALGAFLARGSTYMQYAHLVYLVSFLYSVE